MTPRDAINRVIQQDGITLRGQRVDFPLILSLINKERIHLPRDLPEDDVFGTALLALCQAAKKYDPKRRVKLYSYAYWHVQGSIRDLSRKENKFFSKTEEIPDADYFPAPKRTAIPKCENTNEVLEPDKRNSAITLHQTPAERFSTKEDITEDAARNIMADKLKDHVRRLPSDQRRLVRLLFFKKITMVDRKGTVLKSRNYNLGEVAQKMKLSQPKLLGMRAAAFSNLKKMVESPNVVAVPNRSESLLNSGGKNKNLILLKR